MPTLRFNNHDDCGDTLLTFGNTDFQLWNTATNVFFLVAGARLAACARTTEARQSGVLLLAVGWFSAVYHATSSWGGFLLDIAAMSVWATHLFGCCQVACGALGWGRLLPLGECAAEWRAAACCVLTALAVGGPFVAFEVLGADPVLTWNIWANAFLVLILLAALPALLALLVNGLLRHVLGNVITAIVAILMGVVCTQMIHVVCVPGYFTAFPLHSCWHLCSSTSASFTVWILDEALVMAAARRHADCADSEGPRAALSRPMASSSDKRQ